MDPACCCTTSLCDNSCESGSWSDDFSVEDTVNWSVTDITWSGGVAQGEGSGYMSRCHNMQLTADLDIEFTCDITAGEQANAGVVVSVEGPFGGVVSVNMESDLDTVTGSILGNTNTVSFTFANDTYYTVSIRLKATAADTFTATLKLDSTAVHEVTGLTNTNLFGCSGKFAFNMRDYDGMFVRVTSCDVTDTSGKSLYS